jgi:hypothetical protein
MMPTIVFALYAVLTLSWGDGSSAGTFAHWRAYHIISMGNDISACTKSVFEKASGGFFASQDWLRARGVPAEVTVHCEFAPLRSPKTDYWVQDGVIE